MEYYKKNIDSNVMTAEEEYEVFTKVKNGDTDAREEAITRNSGLVISIAKIYNKPSLLGTFSFDDLIQEGMIGLMMAVDRFDPELGNRFSTFATYWIKQSIIQFIIKNGRTIRIPTINMNQIISIFKAQAALNAKNNREPTMQEIADYCNENGMNRKNKKADGTRAPLTAEEVANYLDTYEKAYPYSLDKEYEDEEKDDTSLLVDSIEDLVIEGPEETTENKYLTEVVDKAVNKLDDRKKKIIQMRFGWDDTKPLTLRETAPHFGVTYERVRQLENDALEEIEAQLHASHNDTL